MTLNHLMPFFADAPAPAPALTLRHAYSITVGSNSGQTGYWFNKAGSITDGVLAIPNGNNVSIRQTMIGASVGTNELRFLINNDTVLTVGSADQFPVEIRISRSGRTATAVRKDPVEISSFGQGIGMDYAFTAAGVGLFQNGVTLSVELYY